jgi:hypothetical protein
MKKPKREGQAKVIHSAVSLNSHHRRKYSKDNPKGFRRPSASFNHEQWRIYDILGGLRLFKNKVSILYYSCLIALDVIDEKQIKTMKQMEDYVDNIKHKKIKKYLKKWQEDNSI